MKAEEVPQELIDILDTRAGMVHNRQGFVVKTLAEVLTRYDEMRHEEAEELRALNDMAMARIGEATERWRAEDPKERALIMPDLGRLVQWLMDQADQAAGTRPALGVSGGTWVSSFGAMKAHLGRRVDVLLGADEDATDVFRTGVLVGLEESGEFCLRGEDMFRCWYWPALGVREPAS